jgi:hypothetical protein
MEIEDVEEIETVMVAAVMVAAVMAADQALLR